MSVGGEFGRRVSDDELCAEVRQAIEGGDEDALRRLGFGGFAEYAQRLSEIMSDSVTDGFDLSADDFGAIMGEVASPARYAHHLVNEAGTAIQSAKDAPLGIHMKPAEPDFDDDALCGTVGTAANAESPEQTVGILADGLAYAVKKSGNEFIEKNAEQRSRAGFEVKVKRSGSTKCCPWCAARIGSWSLKNAPDGVFGCHANCSCVVEYTSSTGAVSQRRGTGRFVEVEYQPPHVMTHGEAREKGGFDEPKRLTEAPKRGTMLPDIVIGRSIGAKAKNYDIMDLETGEKFHLVEGSHLQNVEVFAGKGGYKPYKNAWKYARDFGGKVEDWQHVKGFGLVDYYGEARKAELHWSQCAGFGKHDFFIKRWLDEG
ncbi:MAG: hypothetical protein IIZ73_00890 [Ruminococcus sp.]|nr:hypothetical protein [Ruminococcus sp.]